MKLEGDRQKKHGYVSLCWVVKEAGEKRKEQILPYLTIRYSDPSTSEDFKGRNKQTQ